MLFHDREISGWSLRNCADHECPVVARSPGAANSEEESMKWETPEYTVVEVCAEATGYFYRG